MTLRVVHVVMPTFGKSFSGITHRVFSLLSGWNDKDVTLDLYGSSIKPLNMASGDMEYKLPEGVLWSSNMIEERSGRIRWSFELLLMLIKRRKEYDIVQFHSINWGMLFSPLLLHLFGKKAIFSMSLFGNDNPGYIRNRPRGRLQLTLLRQFDGAIGISPALEKDAKENGIRNVVCIPNFLAFPQLKRFKDSNEQKLAQSKSREIFGFSQNAQILLFVGCIIFRKGVDILVDAFLNLAPVFPKLQLVLVGPQSKIETTRIDDDYVNEVKEKIRTANMEDRVHWIGMVRDQSFLVDYYHAADIFVLPTRNEGLGNVLIEAMAAGLPVVTSSLPGITDEVVSNDVTGYLIEVEKTDDFAKAVREILKNDAVRFRMGDAGQEIVLKKFGFASYCQALKNYYIHVSGLHENH